MRQFRWFVFFVLLANAFGTAVAGCGERGLWLQVLGSGGPELDGRASTGYLVWQDGKARVLVDMGNGSLLRFEQAGARLTDLDVILFTHFHVDHSGDLPGLIKASFFTGRDRDLPVYGPTGNQLMPAATEFVQNLFAATGAYRYLEDYLDGREAYRLLAHDVPASGRRQQEVYNRDGLTLTAVPVHHGPIPALAWRIVLAGRVIVISGDMNGENNTLASLAEAADLLVAHHAIPEQAHPVARNLHMPPSVIGQVAGKARVRQLVLSHRMQRTIGLEAESMSLVRQAYSGPLAFAEDLQCFKP